MTISLSETDHHIAAQSMFEHSSLGIIVVDEKGGIVQANPHAYRLFGYCKEELIGKKIEILIPQNLRDKHVGHRNQYHDSPKDRSMGIGMDLRAVRKDGTEFPVEISLASYQLGTRRETVSFISDITERKKIEEALKKLNADLENKVEERTKELSQALLELHHINEDLKKESELKSRFVSMASHEFRTPLGGILTSATLIARYNDPADVEKRAKHIHTIQSSVKNLTSILNDFLSLDKLEGGKIECHPSTFAMIEFSQEIVREMQTATKKGQRILDSYQGQKDQVFLDKDMLRNVFINLLSNAIKYSPENSELGLSAVFSQSQVVIVIQDHGIGIPEADQKNLFEKFFRAGNVSTVQGTGLGLNIIKRYLDLMGGSIHFASRENEGSTFTITLPREVGV